MRLLKATFSDAEALLSAYQSQFLHGGIFVGTRARHELGSRVVVEISFPEVGTNVLIRGVVSWSRPARRKGQQLSAGIGVEFLPAERRKRDYLLSVARREIVEIGPRRHRRIPVDLVVDWRPKRDSTALTDPGTRNSGRVTSHIDDIGERGAFVRTRNFIPVGSPLFLEITAPGTERPVTIEARVSWTEHTEGNEGMGLAFKCRDGGGVRRLRELIRRIEATTLPRRTYSAG